MPRLARPLSPLAVQRLKEPGLYFVGTVPGLALQVLPSGARTWILRAMIGGKRRDMGLGGFPAVPLADAHAKARAARHAVSEGRDPVAERRSAKSALASSRGAQITFAQATDTYLKAHSGAWRNAKHAAQWRSTLETYAFPSLGTLLVQDIALQNILGVLEPIWHEKTETAVRLRGRVEAVLDWAIASGYREGPNPARWRGHLDKMLARPSKLARREHHAALPVVQVGAFMKALRKQDGMGARALEFAILTAGRSGEVRGAKWPEIDVKAKVWTVPGERMKAGKEHRVPLSLPALKLIKELPRFAESEYVFPSPTGGVLSDMTLSAVLRRMKVEAVPHGFRSTFRDWCSEKTNFPHEVAEMALAHAIANKVEAAYRRGDLFAKRREMMDRWAQFCNRSGSDRT